MLWAWPCAYRSHHAGRVSKCHKRSEQRRLGQWLKSMARKPRSPLCQCLAYGPYRSTVWWHRWNSAIWTNSPAWEDAVFPGKVIGGCRSS
jgi:hypothetical protein